MRIGILAIQGAFIEHINAFRKLGVECFEIRQKKDCEQPMDGLVLPGGESTVIGKLLHELDIYNGLVERINNGLPVFGTCAGLILLAREIVTDNAVYFGCMDIYVRRNAYGRQLGSFDTVSEFKGIGNFKMVFIRAPYIESVDDNVNVLATVDGHIVAARQGKILVTAFHPELTEDLSVHQFFLDMVSN